MGGSGSKSDDTNNLNELASPQDRRDSNIERTALDQRGTIGSFYDARTDNIEGKLADYGSKYITPANKTIRCELIKGSSVECQNLLKLVGIDHQLRLSILTNLCPPVGIASVISYPKKLDDFTRLLRIYHEKEVQSDENALRNVKIGGSPSRASIQATHVITQIVRGIHILVIFTVPEHLQEEIDALFKKYRVAFINREHPASISTQEGELLQRLKIIAVFSNIPTFTQLHDIKSIYRAFISHENESTEKLCLKYILTPIEVLYRAVSAQIPRCDLLPFNKMEIIEYYIITGQAEILSLHFNLHLTLFESLQGKCKQQLEDILKQLEDLQVLHSYHIERVRSTVIQIRQGVIKEERIEDEAKLIPSQAIEDLKRNITSEIDRLHLKANFLEILRNDDIEYCDVSEFDILPDTEEYMIQDMLLGNVRDKMVCLATDKMREGDATAWPRVYSHMINKRKENPNISLVYADFTNSPYILDKIKVYPDSQVTTPKSSNSHCSPPVTIRKSNITQRSEQTADHIINILLLGESGVGKSTFINAFANYLHFHSLDEAQRAKPIVVIPVSFLLTINDDFDEKVIKFGDIDTNEYHNDDGQSVTQSCKCYVLNISNKKKLRIIDTPGFGDTRGCDQDDLNMKNIFSFLNNFDRIHAVCLLFKPEVARLNQYFRSLCIQLLEYFGDEITDRFVFCFTNARSTFFAPGNTRPLVNAVLSSVCGKRVQCEKTNTFCFDSEAFRYSVAVQAKVEFEEAERSEFEQSWLKSTVESKRFRDWLCERQAYRRDVEWKSMGDAKFQIEMLVRPIVETVRNCLRNIILYDSHTSVVLSAEAADPSTTICYRCSYKSRPERCGKLWILFNHLHDLVNTCAAEEQKPVQYRLTYISAPHVTMESKETLNYYQKLLCETASKFSVFLKENISDQFSDPSLSGIAYIIDEERFVCDKQPSSDLNKQLLQRLKEWKKSYEKSFYERKSMDVKLDLSNIYELIASVKKIPMVQHQLDAIRTHQWHVIEQNQHNIDTSEVSSKRMSKNNFRGLQLT